MDIFQAQLDGEDFRFEEDYLEELMDISDHPLYYGEFNPRNQPTYSTFSFDYKHPRVKEEHDSNSFLVPVKTEPMPPSHVISIPNEPFELQDIDIVVETQPPVEVRTRTPSEIRTFAVATRVEGNYQSYGASIMTVNLCYAATAELKSEPVGKDILGGTRTIPVLSDGTAVFDSLSICESSTKHKEREFCLEFLLLRNDGEILKTKKSRPFYAYSHKKVLQRRGNVKLRSLNKPWGRISGGEQMHVIGQPFIQGPSINLVFRTAHGDVAAKPLEYYSDSVLFFELPPYPIPEGMVVTQETEFRAHVLVTNDGRTYSNPLEFTYVATGTDRDRPRSRY